jgi:hypothetical protein
MMKHGWYIAAISVLTVVGSSMIPAVTYAESAGVTDPEKWYAESYGPLWHDNPWDRLEEILSHYHSDFWYHPAEGEPDLQQTDKRITEAMEEWRAEGWTSSEVPDIRLNRINDSTASFTTRWLDHYSNREDDYSCAWYLADVIDGKWKFTHFAPIDCESHGF